MLVLTLSFSFVHATVSLGISHHDVDGVVAQGETAEFDIARITNNGNEAMHLTTITEIAPDNLNYSVTCPAILNPSESSLVFLVVNASALGNYTFSVEFKIASNTQLNKTGGVLVPGGTATGKFQIVKALPTPTPTPTPQATQSPSQTQPETTPSPLQTTPKPSTKPTETPNPMPSNNSDGQKVQGFSIINFSIAISIATVSFSIFAYKKLGKKREKEKELEREKRTKDAT